MDCQLDIFFLEAIINGLLLAGLLALLALGLNLIFGVIDVVWICYAELVMVGMYGMNYAYKGGVPFVLAAVFAILLVAFSGALLHFLVIRPVLDTPPVTSSWLIGGVSSTGRITRKCSSAPENATSRMANTAASTNGTPPL